MLKKSYRFHSRGGVKYVYRNGKTIRTAKMSLIFCANTKGFTRMAVVVSKKVDKTAVGRNLIRRRVYEVLRLNLDKVPKKTDYILVVYTKEVAKMPFEELEERVMALVEESKVCYNDKNGR